MSCNPAIEVTDGVVGDGSISPPQIQRGSLTSMQMEALITVRWRDWNNKIVVNEAPPEVYECGEACEEPDLQEDTYEVTRTNSNAVGPGPNWLSEHLVGLTESGFWGGVDAVLSIGDDLYPLYSYGMKIDVEITIELSANGAPWPAYVVTRDGSVSPFPFTFSRTETQLNGLDEEGYPDGSQPPDMEDSDDFPIGIRFALPPIV
jgi:hypothetical protein